MDIDIQNDEWHIPSWDELFMRKAYLIATKSKDAYTKIGAVIVKDNIPLCDGFNGLPRKLKDDVSERYTRPEKYFWSEHAERNAIYNCARKGKSTEGATIYCFACPCADCMRGIIQSEITTLVIHHQWENVIGINCNSEKWMQSSARSKLMIQEAGIELRVLDMKLNVKTMVDGKVYIV